MQLHQDMAATLRIARKQGQFDRRPPFDRAAREAPAVKAAGQRPAPPHYGCVEWYFYEDKGETRKQA